jgi:HEAT repeat protein
MDAAYSGVDLIASCALGSLRLFPADVAAPLTLRTLERRGANSGLAYFISWHAQWFQDDREHIVRAASSFLTSNDDAIVIGALRLLSFGRHFDWPDDAALREADRAVKTAASKLMSRSDRVAHELANTLGATKDPDVRELLNEIAARHPGAREQAVIALRWLDAANAPTVSRSPDPVIREALAGLESTDASIRKAAAQALLDLAQQSLRESHSVTAYLIDGVIRRPGGVRAETWRDAALILGRLRSPLAGVLTLYLERDGAVDALVEAGEPVVPAVGDVLKVGGPARRRLAAQVLGAIGGAEARGALTAALKQESDPAAKRAIEAALSRLR